MAPPNRQVAPPHSVSLVCYVLSATVTFLCGYKKVAEAAVAAVSILPVIASIHGIVLAVVHVQGQLDRYSYEHI